MRRTTVVLPEPDPPATPTITRGSWHRAVRGHFFLGGNLLTMSPIASRMRLLRSASGRYPGAPRPAPRLATSACFAASSRPAPASPARRSSATSRPLRTAAGPRPRSPAGTARASVPEVLTLMRREVGDQEIGRLASARLAEALLAEHLLDRRHHRRLESLPESAPDRRPSSAPSSPARGPPPARPRRAAWRNRPPGRVRSPPSRAPPTASRAGPRPPR